MTQQQPQTESWMNGAAIVLSDGREVPITDAMVRSSLAQLADADDTREEPLRKVG
ncbi:MULTISPECIES: PA1571 family protein [Marinobacter]|uniref:PA1571 family protein n=1 Tax=Marinobacter TaxID=2742 RepID=UPI0013A6A0E7|nr:MULTISPECIES: PA1571 family protein [Marinobacter]